LKDDDIVDVKYINYFLLGCLINQVLR